VDPLVLSYWNGCGAVEGSRILFLPHTNGSVTVKQFRGIDDFEIKVEDRAASRLVEILRLIAELRPQPPPAPA
jgi:hypothetical protein